MLYLLLLLPCALGGAAGKGCSPTRRAVPVVAGGCSGCRWAAPAAQAFAYCNRLVLIRLAQACSGLLRLPFRRVWIAPRSNQTS